ncbi:hypothetical protein DCC39_14215 [Pueribacillus theae]|uniref:NADH:flavin oxidoreductase/NADH oxidase N-terminal domain-containing protein n=1 Tax=Pueribacillus theae TaxID=2171751 RepID=A0A2U1JVA3_9BACI|nr:hypothetical protein DCC39_14215 [Pueribacillus theae]
MKDLSLKNRIVMAPMCMYSCPEQDGKITNWNLTHYTTRAVGQVGLVIVEASAVSPEGRISMEDLGIWDDEQIAGLTKLTKLVHEHGAKISIQLAHAGRKSRIDGSIKAPSVIPFSYKSKTPQEMTIQQIEDTVASFKKSAYWAFFAAKQLGVNLEGPIQYRRGMGLTFGLLKYIRFFLKKSKQPQSSIYRTEAFYNLKY